MPKVHVLERQGNNLYRCIVHFAVPTGSNSVGVTWQASYVSAGLARASALPVGTGGGYQITTAENNQLTTGALIESEFSFVYDPAWTTAQVNAALDTEANVQIATRTAELQTLLRYYGYTRT